MEVFPAVDGPVPDIDPTRPHAARIYDYGLGGKNHFAADRAMADEMFAKMPVARTTARENRKFLGRAVRYLVEETGVRQFLNMARGCRPPTTCTRSPQRIDPTAHVVYADNDPLVLVHARALLTKLSPQGRTGYIHADLRDPQGILDDPVTRKVLDFSQPIALMIVGVLTFLTDDDQPGEILATLLDALPAGSYFAATHYTAEHDPEMAVVSSASAAAAIPGQFRESDEFARLAFRGLDLVPPGVVLVSEWRPRTTGRSPRGPR